MKTSFVIPNYNYGRFLPELLDSLITQKYEDWEAIIADDGSTDNSWEILTKYQAQDSRIIIIKGEHKGHQRAMNVALEKSSGEFISMLGSDDKIDPNFWNITLPYFYSSKIGVINIGFIEWYPEQVKDKWIENKWRKPAIIPAISTILKTNVIHISSPFRREVLNDIGYMDEQTIWADWDFWIRVLFKGWQVAYCHKPVVWYRIHGGSITLNSDHANAHNYIQTKYEELFKLYNISKDKTYAEDFGVFGPEY